MLKNALVMLAVGTLLATPAMAASGSVGTNGDVAVESHGMRVDGNRDGSAAVKSRKGHMRMSKNENSVRSERHHSMMKTHKNHARAQKK